MEVFFQDYRNYLVHKNAEIQYLSAFKFMIKEWWCEEAYCSDFQLIVFPGHAIPKVEYDWSADCQRHVLFWLRRKERQTERETKKFSSDRNLS